MTTIEIEDTNGNTLCHFVLKGKHTLKDLGIMEGCSLADEEEDYFNEEPNLLRIQLQKESDR